MNQPLRLVIIGAGALTESVYLPVLKNSSLFQVTCLVDTNETQARKMAALYAIPHVLNDLNELNTEHADAALVVLPNFLHASAALSVMGKGIHVLVEKPMAIHSTECLAMIAKAESMKVSLAVGLVRRFYPTTEFLRDIVQHQSFGKLMSFDFQEGYVFDWKLQSDYLLSKNKAGGGVLVDTGIHLLDQLIYCIGVPSDLSYFDDNAGGVESECKLTVIMTGGVKGTIAFSRIRALRNTMKFNFEHAQVEVGLNAQSEVKITLANGITLNTPVLHEGQVIKNKGAFAAQLADFFRAITTGESSKIHGLEGLKSVQLVEQCYASRKSIHEIQTQF